RTYLNNPVGVREAALAEPVQRTVGGRVRYVACLRYAERQSDGTYRDVRDRAVLFVNGRLDRMIQNPTDECADAVYAAFSELEKLLLSAVASSAFAAPAFAADIPARTYTKAPAYSPPAVIYNWTGFYIGGHVGGAFAGDNSFIGNDARFVGGVQGGFDYQFAPN